MNYWRMQLHPDDNNFSSFYAHQSIGKGFIGLGFKNDVGDLSLIENKKILGTQKEYLPFANEMQIGDLVLIMSHHNPIAVVRVKSHYNYIKNTLPKLGVWFRHFRQIDDDVIYYSDFMTNTKNSQTIPMSNTIQMVSHTTQSAKLIQSMVNWEFSKCPQSIFSLDREQYKQSIGK